MKDYILEASKFMSDSDYISEAVNPKLATFKVKFANFVKASKELERAWYDDAFDNKVVHDLFSKTFKNDFNDTVYNLESMKEIIDDMD